MKFLIFFILIFIFQVFSEESSAGDAQEAPQTEADSGDSEEEEALMKFLFEEVIPAFGGFQDLLFSNKPSFDIHWTPQGMQVRSCSFEFQLKQLRTIRYNLADMELYGFQSNAEIGDPRFLFVQISCGETNNVENTVRFNFKFFVTDENLNPSYYSLKIKTMDKEQLDIKLDSIEMDVDVEAVDYTLISDQYGHVEILPHDSPLLKFFKEDEAYAEIAEDQDKEDIAEDKQTKDMYDVPASVWNQIKRVTEELSDEGSLVPLKKTKVEYTIHLKGSAEMFLPVYTDGVKQDASVVMPIVGRIFSPVEGDIIPVIDISTRQ